MTLDEILEKRKKEKAEELEKAKKKEMKIGEAQGDSSKPPKGPPGGGIEKLSAKSPKNKFASSNLGPSMQLNTIEEDLHET